LVGRAGAGVARSHPRATGRRMDFPFLDLIKHKVYTCCYIPMNGIDPRFLHPPPFKMKREKRRKKKKKKKEKKKRKKEKEKKKKK
jgi:hypothetical protein